MSKYYNVNIPKLKHNELVQVVNQETGEVRDVKCNKSPSNNMRKFDLMKTYHRRNTAAWDLLQSQTTDKEYKVADKLAKLARAYTSALEPLNPDSSILEIAEYLKEDRRTISKTIDKLFKLGVIGKFEVYNANEQHTKYWVFNPYLSFNGNVIKAGVPTLFDETIYAKIMR
tara:strand:- start:907 stop:1419 length:513 start_codon:yes stop_codon:yes gene_type:complete